MQLCGRNVSALSTRLLPQGIPPELQKLAVAYIMVTFCEFLNLKSAEKYVLTYEKALIFTVLTFLSDSLRILSLIWMHYSRLLYLFWYFKRLQGALHLKIIGLFTHPVPFNWHICLLEHFIIILGIIKSSPVPKFMKKKCSPTVCSLTHNGMSAIIWV